MWHPEWNELDEAPQADLRARQGVANLVSRPLRVIDDAGRDVPADGSSVGEIVVRGNNVMVGYYRDPASTADATTRRRLAAHRRSGLLHGDGYVEIVDRRKGVIISGGENIASVEVERVLAGHPDVVECAVVGRPDNRWGEVPVAFVTLREGASVNEQELIDHVRARLAHFKAPKQAIVAALPKTSTGKIRKNELRQGWS